ncbi:DNA-binding response regulator [Sporosarcina sp. P37]|uniref:response regulator n=1 Tax=unclassified Sporosarcina TaxID=2647733 RepID=UPI0009BFB71C|nr:MULTISPECIES: response regulator [unclassified Sporosarcina]ARD47921.1 transcriptional regulator [Sporosarcina sp. P33]ARK24451.1 DNA-binding response regulator [Sporosarcina sp. P37]PID18322.1 DNA-binding response regulator [Sporosarcina sp. P35]
MIHVGIVEDDFRIASIHQQFLESIDGVKVVWQALRAKEAWGLLENQPVDLLLVDVYMPDQLGIDLVRELKVQYPLLDFIVITAAADRELVAQSVAAGAFHYLVKPVELAKLKEVIERYQQRRLFLKESPHADQEQIDKLFVHNTAVKDSETNLPKGIHPLTLQKVMDIVHSLNEGTTAEEVGERLGASRTTARRYLEHLIAEGKMRAELEYGIVGRPERKYFAL